MYQSSKNASEITYKGLKYNQNNIDITYEKEGKHLVIIIIPRFMTTIYSCSTINANYDTCHGNTRKSPNQFRKYVSERLTKRRHCMKKHKIGALPLYIVKGDFRHLD